MHAARRAGKASFTYKGNSYKRSKTKTGLVVYRKVGGVKKKARGGSTRSGGSVTSGGSMSEQGRAVNKYGRRGTVLARKATNTVVNRGGAMTEQGRKVNKYGRRATVLARKATNTVVNRGPEAMELAQDISDAVGGRMRRKRRKRKY
jgi:hypothetical protein